MAEAGRVQRQSPRGPHPLATGLDGLSIQLPGGMRRIRTPVPKDSPVFETGATTSGDYAIPRSRLNRYRPESGLDEEVSVWRMTGLWRDSEKIKGGTRVGRF